MCIFLYSSKKTDYIKQQGDLDGNHAFLGHVMLQVGHSQTGVLWIKQYFHAHEDIVFKSWIILS